MSQVDARAEALNFLRSALSRLDSLSQITGAETHLELAICRLEQSIGIETAKLSSDELDDAAAEIFEGATVFEAFPAAAH